MTTYTNFAFYSNEYGGSLSEGEYNKLVVKACSEINAITTGRTDPSMVESLEFCECELVDVLYTYSNGADAAVGVNSINNDGYSISYEGSKDTLSRKRSEILSIITRWLCQPVNLIRGWY